LWLLDYYIYTILFVLSIKYEWEGCDGKDKTRNKAFSLLDPVNEFEDGAKASLHLATMEANFI